MGAEAAVRGRRDSAGPPRPAMLAGADFPPGTTSVRVRRAQTPLRVDKGRRPRTMPRSTTRTTTKEDAKSAAEADDQGDYGKSTVKRQGNQDTRQSAEWKPRQQLDGRHRAPRRWYNRLRLQAQRKGRRGTTGDRRRNGKLPGNTTGRQRGLQRRWIQAGHTGKPETIHTKGRRDPDEANTFSFLF